MISIQDGSHQLTLINVFTVKPQKQNDLIEILNEATETVMRFLPGFISASIHRSLEGNKVVNYAQWDSYEDFLKMLDDPDAKQHMKKAAELAESYDPMICEVDETHEFEGKDIVL